MLPELRDQVNSQCGSIVSSSSSPHFLESPVAPTIFRTIFDDGKTGGIPVYEVSDPNDSKAAEEKGLFFF
jgi:hypothetical protein